MSTAKERQAKRRAKIRADSELHQVQLLQDKSPHKQHFVVGKLARSVGLSVSSVSSSSTVLTASLTFHVIC